MASGSSGTIPAIGRLYSGDQGDGIMPSTEQDDATFDYENSPWVGDRTLARIRYEQLEELNNPVLVREALGLSGGNPTSTITIDPHDIRRPVLVPRGFAQDWLAHRDARIKRKLERESRATKFFQTAAGYLMLALQPIPLSIPFGWWMSRGQKKVERRRLARSYTQRPPTDPQRK